MSDQPVKLERLDQLASAALAWCKLPVSTNNVYSVSIWASIYEPYWKGFNVWGQGAIPTDIVSALEQFKIHLEAYKAIKEALTNSEPPAVTIAVINSIGFPIGQITSDLLHEVIDNWPTYSAKTIGV